MTRARSVVTAVTVLVATGCSATDDGMRDARPETDSGLDGAPVDPRVDAPAPAMDSGSDATTDDAGGNAFDAAADAGGSEGGIDGAAGDAGNDSGSDTGVADAGRDAAPDAGPADADNDGGSEAGPADGGNDGGSDTGSNLDAGPDGGPHGSVTVTVSGTTTSNNPVTVTVPAGAMVALSEIAGTVCLDSGFACTGPTGLTQNECNDLSASGDECVCSPTCTTEPAYGALLRDSCIRVVNETFVADSTGEISFYINQDCNPQNNSGAFQVTVSY